MKLKHMGVFGIISLLSYTAMVVFSPLAFPGYNSLSRAVSDLSAVGAPSAELAKQLNSLFGPCAVVSATAVCVGVYCCKSKLLKLGVYFFALMEWVTVVGYTMFPLVQGEPSTSFQNVMHIIVTVLVVVLSVLSLIFIAFGSRKEKINSLSIWALICFALMLIGAVGTSVAPKSVFGLFERFSTFSVVIFNAVLCVYLFKEKFSKKQNLSE